MAATEKTPLNTGRNVLYQEGNRRKPQMFALLLPQLITLGAMVGTAYLVIMN